MSLQAPQATEVQATETATETQQENVLDTSANIDADSEMGSLQELALESEVMAAIEQVQAQDATLEAMDAIDVFADRMVDHLATANPEQERQALIKYATSPEYQRATKVYNEAIEQADVEAHNALTMAIHNGLRGDKLEQAREQFEAEKLEKYDAAAGEYLPVYKQYRELKDAYESANQAYQQKTHELEQELASQLKELGIISGPTDVGIRVVQDGEHQIMEVTLRSPDKRVVLELTTDADGNLRPSSELEVTERGAADRAQDPEVVSALKDIVTRLDEQTHAFGYEHPVKGGVALKGSFIDAARIQDNGATLESNRSLSMAREARREIARAIQTSGIPELEGMTLTGIQFGGEIEPRYVRDSEGTLYQKETIELTFETEQGESVTVGYNLNIPQKR